MAANIEWTLVFLSLACSYVVVYFFCFVDWRFFRFFPKWPNDVVSDLGRFLLTFYSAIMVQVDRLTLLMLLTRLYGVGLNMPQCGNLTTSSVVPTGYIALPV